MKLLIILLLAGIGYLIIAVILILLALGFAWALAMIIPELSIGMGLVAGSIFSVWSVYFFLKLLAFIETFNPEYENDDWEFDEPVVIMPPKLRRASGSSKARKKKHR